MLLLRVAGCLRGAERRSDFLVAMRAVCPHCREIRVTTRDTGPRGYQMFAVRLDEYCLSIRRTLAARLYGDHRWAFDAWRAGALTCASVRHISDMNLNQ